MKKYVITIIVVAGIILLLFGSYYIYSSNNSQDTIDNLKLKVDEEIDYLDTTIISMMNQFHNINYANYKIVEKEVPAESQDEQSSSSGGQEGGSGGGGSGGSSTQSQSSSNTITNMTMNYSSILVNPNKKVDWNEIKKETEKMYHTWTTVLIDLNSLNINQDNLLKYTTVLDNITKSVQKEDTKTTLRYLADLYSLLVSYTKEYSNDNQRIIILDTKSNILYAYSMAEEDKWKEMQSYIKKAQNVYHNMMNNTLQNNGNTTSINKAYVLLNEIYKSTETKDKSIFYINYKNLMQELEIIEE